jgi:hypothetical protein
MKYRRLLEKELHFCNINREKIEKQAKYIINSLLVLFISAFAEI